MCRSRWAIIAILVCQCLALGYEAWHLSLTPDEPSHLTAAYMHWTGRDLLFPSDTPPLTRMMSGWVPLLLRAPFSIGPAPLQDQSAYAIGTDMIAGLDGPAARRLIFWCRLPFAIFPLLITGFVWQWGRELFDRSLATLLAGCAALEPTLLGHGALIKSDVAAATMTLLFCYAAWRHWCRAGARTFAWMLLATVAAALTKFSLLPLVPVAIIIVLYRGPRRLGPFFILLGVYTGILASYQFQIQMYRFEDLDRLLHFAVPGQVRELFLVPMQLVPWPVQFLRGIGFIGSADLGGGFVNSQMLGRRLVGAAPLYFPLCLAIKLPVSLQILSVAGLAASMARVRGRVAGAADALLWIPALGFFLVAVRSHIHLGFRHLLPIVPLVILGAGFGLQRWARLRVIVLWLLGASVFIYPHGISYFNEWIGGPANGWKYLVDSNIDWGQDLGDLGRYVKEHRISHVRTAYFGPEPVSHVLPEGAFDQLPTPSNGQDSTRAPFVPGPGVYAISVNLLAGSVLPPESQDYFAWFRGQEPEGSAGWSIRVYKVGP